MSSGVALQGMVDDVTTALLEREREAEYRVFRNLLCRWQMLNASTPRMTSCGVARSSRFIARRQAIHFERQDGDVVGLGHTTGKRADFSSRCAVMAVADWPEQSPASASNRSPP